MVDIKCQKCWSENLDEGDSFHWDLWWFFSSNYVIITELFCRKCGNHFKFRSSQKDWNQYFQLDDD